MYKIQFSTATYEDCKEELIAFRNANRDEERNALYLNWRYKKRPNKLKPIIVWAENVKNEKIGSLSLIPHHFCINNRNYHVGLLGDISVSSAWRGKGLAGQMFRYLTELKEVKKLKLCLVLPNNAASRSLEKAGWQVITQLNRYVKLVNIEGKINDWIKPLWLLKLISSPINLILGLLSLEVFLKGSLAYKGELIDEIDDRFNELWENTNKQGTIIGFRNKEYLSWKYLKHPIVKYSIFTLTENSRLCGYIIFHNRENTCIIDDIFFHNKKIYFAYLLSYFIRYTRKNMVVATICISANKNTFLPPFWLFGFFRRPDYQKCMIHIQKPELGEQSILHGHKWFLTAGDKDT